MGPAVFCLLTEVCADVVNLWAMGRQVICTSVSLCRPMSFPIQIRPGDELPIYRQIVRQVLDALAAGSLRAGDRMESHRELAARLVVAPLTVKKAYDELERDGYLEMRRGRGTFVRTGVDESARSARVAALEESVARVCREAVAAGLSAEELVKRVRAAMGDVVGLTERGDDA